MSEDRGAARTGPTGPSSSLSPATTPSGSAPRSATRLTVCVVLPADEPYSQRGGAIATVTRNVTRIWEDQGSDVTILVSDADRPYREGRVIRLPQSSLFSGLMGRVWQAVASRARAAEARMAPWGGADSRPYRRAVGRALEALPVTPDVVVVHNDPLLARTIKLAVPRARSVLWLHNQVDPRCLRSRRLFVAPSDVVAVSQYIADWTQNRYRLPPDRIRVVLNGVDLERFHPTEAVPGGVEDRKGPVRVVCHGRLDPNKGFHLAVDAVERLRRDGHDVILTIAGAVQVWHLTAAEASRYGERLVADLEAGGGTYLGRLDPSAVPAMLREHQIACVPSLADEPFSLSALEAMASGCAVVASRRGGLPEVVGDAGTLFDPDDTDGLVAALVPLVTDPDLLADRRRSARVRSETFPWTATATGVLTPDPPE